MNTAPLWAVVAARVAAAVAPKPEGGNLLIIGHFFFAQVGNLGFTKSYQMNQQQAQNSEKNATKKINYRPFNSTLVQSNSRTFLYGN